MSKSDICCCEGFKSRSNNIGNKGFSIKREGNVTYNEFYFEFRAVDSNRKEILVEAFREKLLGMKLPSMSLEGKIKINFCPWCGNKL